MSGNPTSMISPCQEGMRHNFLSMDRFFRRYEVTQNQKNFPFRCHTMLRCNSCVVTSKRQ
jgi:hypothetical protein